VPQQILHRGGSVHWLQAELSALLHRHLLRREFRQVFRDRIIQQQPALLHQHHRGHRDNRLGHRVDAEDRIARHRRARGRVLAAQVLEQRHLAAPRHQGHGARQALPVDLDLQDVEQPLGAQGTQADVGRRGKWQVVHRRVPQAP
jgi:hypothetical protein